MKGREKERDLSLLVDFPNLPHWPGLDQTATGGQELHPGLLRWCVMALEPSSAASHQAAAGS